jgi:hypothetical protein
LGKALERQHKRYKTGKHPTTPTAQKQQAQRTDEGNRQNRQKGRERFHNGQAASLTAELLFKVGYSVAQSLVSIIKLATAM